MPRCAISAISSDSSSHRYLPRRRVATTLWPVSRPVKSPAPSRCRRIALGWCTSTFDSVRPVMCSSRPSRTTSTSGNSGTLPTALVVGLVGAVGLAVGLVGVEYLGQRPPGGLGRLLLGFLLGGAVAAAAVLPRDDHRCGELLAVVGALFLDAVLGHAEARRRRQLLQGRLPVEPGAQERR